MLCAATRITEISKALYTSTVGWMNSGPNPSSQNGRGDVLRTLPSEPAATVESADRLLIQQVQFPSQLTGSPHTVEWGLTRTHAHAVAGHTVYRHETGGPQEMYY